MTIDLRAISNFGGTDADEDWLLLRSFEDHPAYFQILKHEKFCILGRKGSGKTAIFKKILTERRPDAFSFGHTFTDYPWHHHDKQRKIGVPEEQCFVQSWAYLCLISLSKILLNQDSSQPYNDTALGHLERIEKFILDTYGTRDPDVTQVFRRRTSYGFQEISESTGRFFMLPHKWKQSKWKTCRPSFKKLTRILKTQLSNA